MVKSNKIYIFTLTLVNHLILFYYSNISAAISYFLIFSLIRNIFCQQNSNIVNTWHYFYRAKMYWIHCIINYLFKCCVIEKFLSNKNEYCVFSDPNICVATLEDDNESKLE